MNLNIKKNFKLNNKTYCYYSLREFEKQTKLQINNMEAQLKELQRIVNEQEDMLLRTQGGNNMRSSKKKGKCS